jgi:hypothetical protein
MAKDLSLKEQEAVQVLLQDWQDILRCTTIDQALEGVGGPFQPREAHRHCCFSPGEH